MTITATVPTPRRCSPASPAPEAVRCPTPGCYRRRNPVGKSPGRLTEFCWSCRLPGRRPPKPPAAVALAAGKAVVLTAAVAAEVWSVAACRESSAAPPESVTLPAGTRCVAVGRLSKSDGGGDPVVELACGGRFVCPPHAMEVVGAES